MCSPYENGAISIIFGWHKQLILFYYFFFRIPAITDYLCFGLTYFYYDTVVMFYAVYMKEKAKNPATDYISAWKIFYKKKRLIIFHHIFLPIIGFPISNVSTVHQLFPILTNKNSYFIFLSIMSFLHMAKIRILIFNQSNCMGTFY